MLPEKRETGCFYMLMTWLRKGFMVSVLFLLSLDLMVCMFLDTVFPVVGKRVIKHFPEVSCVDNKK